MSKGNTALGLGALAMFAATATTAQAAGFQINSYGVKQLGTAYAGTAATAEDASVFAYNPAGMAYLPGTHFSAGVTSITVRSRHSLEAERTALGQPIDGRGRDTRTQTSLVPNLAVTHQLSDNLVVGVGTYVPFGNVTRYSDNSVARYHSIKSDVRAINFGPAIAYRPHETLSLGVGVYAQYLDATFTNDVFTPLGDARGRAQGSNYGFGFNAGALWEPVQGTRFGVHYRSYVKHDVDGKFDGDAPLPASADLKASVRLPEVVDLSVAQDLGERVTVKAGATWTRWSRIQELRFEDRDNVLGADIVQPLDFEDAWRYSLGASYRHDDNWTFRAGVSYDQTPVRDRERRSARLPDNNRLFFAGGVTYDFTPEHSVDFAYMHVRVRDAKIDRINDSAVQERLEGDYRTRAHLVGIQYNHRF